MDLEDRIDSLLNRVPGYTGYRSKEDRRDDDRRLRDTIAASLDATTAILTSVSAKLASERKLTHISTVERMVGSTRHLADRVRSASYGYGGIFTDRPIDEFALDQLRQFDNAFQTEAKQLADLAGRIDASPEGPLEADINSYQSELNRLGLLFDARGAVVESARPNQDAAVLSLLEPPAEPKVSPLASLSVGDTLSILGENYLVDATVTLSEPDRKVTLSRAGHDAQGAPVWLVGGTTEELASARMVESESDSTTPANGRSAQAIVSTGSETRDGVAAQYAYTASTEGSVSFWYSIGGESRSFTGAAIDDGDIAMYGQA